MSEVCLWQNSGQSSQDCALQSRFIDRHGTLGECDTLVAIVEFHVHAHWQQADAGMYL